MSKYDVCYPRAMSLRVQKCKQETGSENRAKRRQSRWKCGSWTVFTSFASLFSNLAPILTLVKAESCAMRAVMFGNWNERHSPAGLQWDTATDKKTPLEEAGCRQAKPYVWSGSAGQSAFNPSWDFASFACVGCTHCRRIFPRKTWHFLKDDIFTLSFAPFRRG